MHLRVSAAVLVLLLPALQAAAAPRVVHAVLTPEGFAQVFRGKTPDGGIALSVRIPRVKVFGADGGQRADIGGYSAATRGRITAALAAEPGNSAWTLARLLELVRTPDGKAITAEAVSSAGGVVADFYAAWCAPCRALRKDIETLGDDVTILEIESDSRKVDRGAIFRALTAGN